jgi:hypothetical protein
MQSGWGLWRELARLKAVDTQLLAAGQFIFIFSLDIYDTKGSV